MQRTTLSHAPILGYALSLLVAGCSTVAPAQPDKWLSVDMPHGGCSLTVRQDGQASIHFAAMPRWIRVAQGVFELDELTRMLRSRAYRQGEHQSHGEQVGSVSFPGSEELWFIDDDGLVRSLLEQGWKARAQPMGEAEIEDYEWVARACSFQ